MNIHLHIERLVLDGMPVHQQQGPALKAAVEIELTRLLTAGGLAANLAAGGAVSSLPGDPLQPSDGKPHGVGVEIARAVYGGIGQ